jgi:outer membrane protein OmpA-like peptidoglycan-associated protein
VQKLQAEKDEIQRRAALLEQREGERERVIGELKRKGEDATKEIEALRQLQRERVRVERKATAVRKQLGTPEPDDNEDPHTGRVEPPPPEVDSTGAAKSVYFRNDRAILEPEQLPSLIRLAEKLKRTAGRVQLLGWACSRGTQEYNYALADRMALSVKNVLQREGIPPDRLIALSVGEIEGKVPPGASCALSHRVDIRLLD